MSTPMSPVRASFEAFAQRSGWSLARKPDGTYRDKATLRGYVAWREAKRTDAPAMTPSDAVEVARFVDYLTDKKALPADQFAAKWAAYENGAA